MDEKKEVQIINKLDTLIRLTAYNTIKEESLENKINILLNMGLESIEIRKILGREEFKKFLLQILDDDTSKLVYHFSDGSTSRKIAKVTPISFSTVTKYWEKWSEVKPEIVESIPAQRGKRYKKIFSLEDFGIDLSIEFEKNNSIIKS